MIEQALGKYNILSVEDLVHEIFTVGPNFKQARGHLFSDDALFTVVVGFQLLVARQALQPHWWLEDAQIQALRRGR